MKNIAGRTAGCVHLDVIPAATNAVLMSFVKGAVVPQAAVIHTDAWAANRALKMRIGHRLETADDFVKQGLFGFVAFVSGGDKASVGTEMRSETREGGGVGRLRAAGATHMIAPVRPTR